MNIKLVLKKLFFILIFVCFAGYNVFAAIDFGWIPEDSAQMTNVRELAGLKPTKYNVMQGSCSDGNNLFYFAFSNKSNDHILVAKMKLVNGNFVMVSKSKPFNTHHGNDMTYIHNLGGISGNDKILITNSLSGHTNNITVFDVRSMKPKSKPIVCKYWEKHPDCVLYKSGIRYEDSEQLNSLLMEKHGFSAIAYDERNHRLVLGLSAKHDLMIFDLKYKKGTIKLNPTAYIVQFRTDSTFQGIDCDSDYIYSCWSPKANISKDNMIYKYTWQGRLISGSFIDRTYELESLSHINQNGSTEFFATYHHSYKYCYTTTKKIKIKEKVWDETHTKMTWNYRTEIVTTDHKKTKRNAYIKRLHL